MPLRALPLAAFCGLAIIQAAAGAGLGAGDRRCAGRRRHRPGIWILAILKDADPRAADFALFMLPPTGQQIFADYGFAPVALPAPGQ